MERAVLVYTTYPSIVEAERAGRATVERRLAACVKSDRGGRAKPCHNNLAIRTLRSAVLAVYA